MTISYDVKLPERNSFRGGAKSEEVTAIEDFLQGTKKNMCFTYDDDKEAKRRQGSIASWRRKAPEGDLVDVFRNGSRLFVVRLSPKEVKERRAAKAAAMTGKAVVEMRK